LSEPSQAHAAELDAWHSARLAALAAGNGWLNLTDRIEIAPGRHSVGRAEGNDVVLSAGPDNLGQLDLRADGSASFTAGGQTLAFASEKDEPPHLELGGLMLEITEIEGQRALRVRDLSLPKADGLPHIPRYPADPAWRIVADWVALAEPVDLRLDTVRDVKTGVRLTHEARFRHEGRDVTLLATHWKEGKPMFVIRDSTSGGETYAASRFLLGEVTGAQVVLDFNRAFNPPCAFTIHAVCPLPPRQNILPFPVRAGERMPELAR